MFRSHKKRKLETWFDQDCTSDTTIPAAFAGDAELESHFATLARTRRAVQTIAEREQIADAQFPAFMSGIREQLVQKQPRRLPGIWVMASVAAVLLLVTVSTLVVVMGRPADVRAEQPQIESYSTDIKGATVKTKTDKDNATVWVNVPSGDLW